MAYQMPPVDKDEPWYVRLMQEIAQLRLLIQNVDAKITPRADIEAGDKQRVSLELYSADLRNINERLARLEGGSGRIIAWLGVIFGGVGCLGTLASMSGIIFTIIWTLTHK